MPDDETIPVYIHEALMGAWEDQCSRLFQHLKDTRESVDYEHIHTWANMIATYQRFIEILDNPQGGPEVLKRLLREQIELIKKFDAED